MEHTIPRRRVPHVSQPNQRVDAFAQPRERPRAPAIAGCGTRDSSQRAIRCRPRETIGRSREANRTEGRRRQTPFRCATRSGRSPRSPQRSVNHARVRAAFSDSKAQHSQPRQAGSRPVEAGITRTENPVVGTRDQCPSTGFEQDRRGASRQRRIDVNHVLPSSKDRKVAAGLNTAPYTFGPRAAIAVNGVSKARVHVCPLSRERQIPPRAVA